MGVVDWGPLLQELSHINDSAQNLPGIFQKLPILLNVFQQQTLDFSGEWGGIIGLLQGKFTAVEALESIRLDNQVLYIYLFLSVVIWI